MKRFTMMALLFMLCGLSDTGGDSRRGFHFRARLLSASKRSERATLKKGHSLQPIDQNDHQVHYQPVILCNDVELEFDENGLSKEVEILGFCSGPGMRIPLSRVVWWIPGLVNPVVRDHGCGLETIDSVRISESTPGPAMTEEKPDQTCTGSELECINTFDGWLTLEFGISFLKAEKICHRVAVPDPVEVRYNLFCNHAALGQLRSRKP